VLLALAGTGCGGSDKKSSSGGSQGKEVKQVVLQLFARDNPFFTNIADGVKYAAKQKGVKVSINYANNDPASEVSQLQNSITRKPDGLIVSPIDPNALVPPVKQAKQAGIPIVMVADQVAPSARGDLLTYSGSSYTDTGRAKARYIVDQLKGKGNVIFIHEIRGLGFTEEQSRGAKEIFSANPGIKIVGEKYSGAGSREAGLSAAENLLTANPNADAIYADNDDVALGAITAVKNRGLDPKKLVIVGANGTPDAFKAIHRGDLKMTVVFCGFSWGVHALESIYNFVKTGQKPGPPEPEVDITAANIAEKEPALLHGCLGPKA
jgi:ABC-type sugar transport system substrate-binding protein